MKKESLKKKWWLLLIIAAVMSFLLEIVQINTQPAKFIPVETEEVRAQETEIYPARLTENYGYEETENGLIAIQGDPQMFFYTGDCGKVSQVYFSFFKPSETPLDIQIFYPGTDGITEANSVRSNCPSGVEFWSVEIPASEYEYLRVDIDGSPIAVSTIGTGIMPAGREYIRTDIHVRRIVIVAIVLFAAFLWITWTEGWKKIKQTVLCGLHEIKANQKRSMLYAVVFLVIIGVSIGLFWIVYLFNEKTITAPRIVFAGFVGLFAASLIVFRKTLKTQPEYLFLILVLCVGFLDSYYMPHTGLNGWDEDVHYIYALKTSYVDSVVVTQQDQLTQNRLIEPVSYDLNGGIQQLNEYQDMMNQNVVDEHYTFSYPTAIPEFFNGIGLFIGRALRLPYYLIHFLGRFYGLMTYGIVGFFAIRKLKSGKMIAAIALLIPTEMFIASTYNYDCYLTGFTALGLCYYTAQWQDREAKLSLKDALIMIGSITFGCLTKPIYVPLLWIIILLPKDKFPDRKRYIYFVLSLVVATGILAFSYVLPSLLAGGGIAGGLTDVRGGSEVSAPGQMNYILTHPLNYLDVVWQYMNNAYFNLTRVGELLTNYAYHGIMPNQYLYLLLMVVVAFTDKNENDRSLVSRYWAHILPVLISLITVALVISAMYMAFTPVGSTEVLGAQFRYIIPMAFPFLMFIGSGKIENRMDRGWYNGVVLAVAAYVNFTCVYNAFIAKYF